MQQQCNIPIFSKRFRYYKFFTVKNHLLKMIESESYFLVGENKKG